MQASAFQSSHTWYNLYCLVCFILCGILGVNLYTMTKIIYCEALRVIIIDGMVLERGNIKFHVRDLLSGNLHKNLAT